MTDFRALCAELVEELEDWICCDDESEVVDAHSLIDRARAALAEQLVKKELPEGWQMLNVVEPEIGKPCDWVIMASWGSDHGQGEWYEDSAFKNVVKGFSNKSGLMISDPALTAWRSTGTWLNLVN